MCYQKIFTKYANVKASLANIKKNLLAEWKTTLLIYVFALCLILPISIMCNPKSDNIGEVVQSISVIKNGWHPFSSEVFANTSLVTSFIVPTIYHLTHLSVINIYKIILPMIFCLTPVLLYKLLRKFLDKPMAIFSVVFFLLIPPTYKEMPVIAKEQVAETLAVIVLLLLFSNIKNRYRIPLLMLTIILTLWCHYSVGFILLAWLVILVLARLVLYRKDIWLFFPLIGGAVFGYLWFTYASNGVILKTIETNITTYASNSVQQAITQAVTGKDFVLQPVVGQILRINLWLIVGVMGLGVVYLLWHIGKNKLKEFAVLIAVVTIALAIIIYSPKLQTKLFLDRWVQINGMVVCPLFALGSKIVSQKVAYTLISVFTIFSYGLLSIVFPNIGLPQLAWS